MAPSYLDILPTMKISPNDGGTEYHQPTDSVVDVSSYTEAAIFAVVQNMSGSGTAVVTLDTAADNRTEQFLELGDVVSYTTAPSFPDATYCYFAGSSAASNTPGFGRYLRVKVAFGAAGDSLTLGIKAVLKP